MATMQNTLPRSREGAKKEGTSDMEKRADGQAVWLSLISSLFFYFAASRLRGRNELVASPKESADKHGQRIGPASMSNAVLLATDGH
jgi:hypothetical protein